MAAANNPEARWKAIAAEGVGQQEESENRRSRLNKRSSSCSSRDLGEGAASTGTAAATPAVGISIASPMWREAGSDRQLRPPKRQWRPHPLTTPHLLRHTVVLTLLLTGVQLCWAAAYCRNGDLIYDGVQARTLSSQFVFVGKLLQFVENGSATATPSSALPSTKSALTAPNESRPAAAYVLVKSVAKQTLGRIAVHPSDRVLVFGLMPPGAAAASSTVRHAGGGGLGAAAPQFAGCVTSVTRQGDYIFFVNATAADGGDERGRSFIVVRAATNYTRSDFRLARDVACPGCAAPPTVAVKNVARIREGAVNYTLACRADSRLLAAVDWYRNGTRLLLPTAMATAARSSRLRVSETGRVGSVTSTLRWTRVRPVDAGEYVCAARNALGMSSAASRLDVLPRRLHSSSTAPATDAETARHSAATATKRAAERWTPAKVVAGGGGSHYVDCPPSFKAYCLNEGRCQMRPNGFSRHCACAKGYAGVRCAQKGCPGCLLAVRTGQL